MCGCVGVFGAVGGGVLSFAVEHVGDLTHRMTTHFRWPRFHTLDQLVYTEAVEDKVRKTLKILTQGYGFKREHEENLEHNAEYTGEDLKQLQAKVKKELDLYAKYHQQLPAYNVPQFLARSAAVNLGLQKFDTAVLNLKELQRMVKKDWTTEARRYYWDGHDIWSFKRYPYDEVKL